MSKQTFLDISNATNELVQILPKFTMVLGTLYYTTRFGLDQINWSDYNSTCKEFIDKLKQVDEYPRLVSCINRILNHYSKILEKARIYGYLDRILKAKTLEQFMKIINNVRNDITEDTEQSELQEFNIEYIKNWAKESKIKELLDMLNNSGINIFKNSIEQIGGSKDDTIKVLMHKLKVYSYPHLENYFDKIQRLDETSGLETETIELIKSFNKYEYYKLNDIVALGAILYVENEKINLNELFTESNQINQSQTKQEYINLVSDSDTDSD